MLSRSQFVAACDAFLHRPRPSVPSNAPLTGWFWQQHSGYGFLSRAGTVSRPFNLVPPSLADEELLEDNLDDQTAHSPSSPSLEFLPMMQYVVYSPSFQVPVFYFTIHDSHGSPLSLDQILATTLFKYDVSEQAVKSTFALTPSTAVFPLLSQGEHPVLGTPCWYLHPCESGNAVRELMEELPSAGEAGESRLMQWLETWFMVLGSTIRLA